MGAGQLDNDITGRADAVDCGTCPDIGAAGEIRLEVAAIDSFVSVQEEEGSRVNTCHALPAGMDV